GYTSTEMTVGGGAAASDLWMQIHADTSGLPVRIPASADAPSTGSAVLAGVGAGHFATIDEGIAAMVRPGRSVDPIPANVTRYEEIYARHREIYPAARKILTDG
ncbi:FGGY-family carbohydrate kinase, partial [Ovoidimarina sediminis]|uniref:FGGY-family carbohydrate kinase n=1 Tax=Ovoidimarina sediminis TaxID=3079856 RepID=UPI00290932ED